ncbi:MAG: IclR family transcriptional regulator [Ktedonobacterales bacterium]
MRTIHRDLPVPDGERPLSEPADGFVGATGAVDRALAVLCAFSRETPVLGVTELSERLNLTKSTVHRLLQALLARGLVSQDPDRRAYALGYRVLALAQAVPGEASLREVCRPHMQWLRAATEETVGLYVVAGDVRICLDEIESPQMLRMSAGVGRCFPLDRGAASKALLADGPASGALWRRATNALPAPAQSRLTRDTEAVRERGYAASAGETVAGSASIAAPVRGPDGELMAALNVAGPASRFAEDVVPRYATALLEAVARIERDLVAVYVPAAAQPARRDL